ncbi:sperm acrosome associated 5 [Chelydra serpentina]|uniref:Sperm acrosome membrane-associated protein 3 n=1 Tax=Chelydra serpentina TaxID=8475 RepID=A0A8T1RWZ9_CHESE|nr:sperm acrosome associated 5 [Chelydra serpentina]
MGVLGLVTLLACLSIGGRAKIFTRCELAQRLQDSGMDGYEGYSLANWLCLAFYASGFDTAAVGANADGSSDYGIFQINSGWWCQDTQSPSENLCHLRCRGEAPGGARRGGLGGVQGALCCRGVSGGGHHALGSVAPQLCSLPEGAHPCLTHPPLLLDLLTPDIKDDINCVKRVVQDPQGMEAW